MKTDYMRLVLKITASFIIAFILIMINRFIVYADYNDISPMRVVSLGDSYSSGEGIEPFYGQEDNELKHENEDWLAHRSTKSWPSKLIIPGYEGESGNNTLGDYKYNNEVSESENSDSSQILQNNCEWYFVASSGAVTDNIYSQKQIKTVRLSGVNNHRKFTKSIPIQTSVFNSINGPVDFVTITIGGNDVDFAKIIKTCVMGSTYLGSHRLETKLEKLWKNFDTTKQKIEQTYKNVSLLAPDAEIIVVDYPQLLDPEGRGVAISKEEAKLVNENVSKFNKEIEKIVIKCKEEGLRISFVDVETKFNGHEAYSSDPWIKEIKLLASDQELDDKAISSAYSMHPNEEGAEAYAECVNEMIRTLSYTTSEFFTNKQLENIRRSLGIPDDLSVELVISEPYYWEAGEVEIAQVDFYHNGELVAGASFKTYSDIMIRNIFMYSE